MVTSTLPPDACPTAIGPDAHTVFRAEFLELSGRVGMAPAEAVTFAEACTPAELVPFLRDLLALARRTTRTHGGPACHA